MSNGTEQDSPHTVSRAVANKPHGLGVFAQTGHREHQQYARRDMGTDVPDSLEIQYCGETVASTD